MSGDAVLDALQERASGAPAGAGGEDPVTAALAQRAAGKTFSTPADLKPKGNAFSAFREPAFSLASGAMAAIPAGIAGLGTAGARALGLTDAAPEDVVQKVQGALTYEPGTEVGTNALNVLTSPLQQFQHLTHDVIGQKAAELGGPEYGAFVDTELQMAPALFGRGRGAGRAAEPIPGASPVGEVNPYAKQSMGAAAVAPDMASLSPELRARIQKYSGEGRVNLEAMERHVEADKLPVKMRLTKGQAEQDPVQISNELNRRGKDPELVHTYNTQNKQLVENLDEIRRTAAPNAVGNDHIQNGQSLIDSYKAMDEPIRADISAKYKALEQANGGEFPVNGQDFVAAADKALSKKMKGRYVPSQVAGDLADLRDGGPMTFENFENLRTNLAAEARKAERSGDGNAAAAVNIVRESLESLPMTGEAAKIKPLADAARSAAKARFDRLREDPAYRAAVDDSVAAGESSPLADDFVHKYVIKGKSANIKKMQENLQTDPTAQQTIAASALNYIKAKSGVNLYTNEGNFSQSGYNSALGEITPKISTLLDPKTAEMAQTLGNVARYTQVQPSGHFANNSNTFVAAAAEHATNAAEGMANVAAGGYPIGTIVRKAIKGRSEKKFVREALEPGAGIKLKDVLKPKQKKGPQ